MDEWVGLVSGRENFLLLKLITLVKILILLVSRREK